MTLTPEKLDELERLAELATPGPWQQAHRKDDADGMYRTQVFDANGRTIATLAWYPVDIGEGVTGTARETNAKFIASLDPATVRELVRAAKERQWQPIETAPKDGEWYLAADGKGSWTENCPPYHAPGIWTLIDGEWRGWSRTACHKATHWMPLPEVPHD